MSTEEQELICNKINFMLHDRSEDSFPNMECLACCKFFYTRPWSVYDYFTSFYEIENINITEYSDLNGKENLIKSYMCSFLNKKSGGIILIGCERVGASMYANGIILTEKNKESVQQKIETYFPKFEPKINRNQEVKIDFVPVYTNQ